MPAGKTLYLNNILPDLIIYFRIFFYLNRKILFQAYFSFMPKFTSVAGSLKPTQHEGERWSLYGVFYWIVKGKGQARECISKVDWLSLLTVNIPLSPEHRPFSSLAGLTAQVKIFTKTSTAGSVPADGCNDESDPTIWTRRHDRRTNGVFRTGKRCFFS